jgi:hypothetical protein
MMKFQLAIHGHMDVSHFDTKDVRTMCILTDSDVQLNGGDNSVYCANKDYVECGALCSLT